MEYNQLIFFGFQERQNETVGAQVCSALSDLTPEYPKPQPLCLQTNDNTFLKGSGEY